MTATLETETEPEAKRPKRRPAHPCGWCAPCFGQSDGCRDRDHRCKGTYQHGVPANVSADRLSHCPCADAGHQGRREA